MVLDQLADNTVTLLFQGIFEKSGTDYSKSLD